MAAIVNDRDVLILGAVPRYTAPANMDVFLSPPSAIFKQSADLSTASPNSFTFQATLLNLYGAVTFTWSAGLTFTVSGNTATLTYANFTAADGWLKATIVSEGVTYTKTSTITKLADGAQGQPGVGTPGTPGTQTAPVFLYQWNSSTPAAPTGTSTVTWPAATNSAYTGTDGWAVTAPANPGTPGLRLYVVTRTVTAAGTATSTTGISYSGLTATAWTQNGATGPNGTPGVQSFSAEVYQWASTIPAGPVGSPTLNWGTRLFGAAPSGWSLAPGAPVLGATLWAAVAQVLDMAAATSTAFNWNTASIVARGYAGTNGTGTPGAEGVSSFTAYCASTTSAATSVPAATTGKASVPATNSGGIVGAWSRTAPTSLTQDQRIWEVDGTYNPATDQITYQFPYWSVWKVGSLSAITLGVMGNITAGSMDIGSGANSWHVDPNGNMWSGATTIAAAPFVVMNNGQLIASAATFKTADGIVLFSTGGGLALAGAAPGTVNADLAPIVSNMIASNSLPTEKGKFSAGSSLSASSWEGPIYNASGPPANGVYSPYNRGVIYTHAFGTPEAGRTIDLYLNVEFADRIPVIPGQRYEAGVALSAHRCVGRLIAVLYDANGGYISELAGNDISVGNTYTTTPGDAFPRSLVYFTATAATARVMLIARMYANGGNDPYLFASEWYQGRASITQTIGTKYTEFSSTGINAAVIAAQQTANAAKAIADAQSADGILDRGEKSLLKGQWAEIVGEYPRLITSATVLSIGAEKDNYTAAYTALVAYLNGIGPGGSGGWQNTDVDSPIDRAVHIAKFGDYADKKMILSTVLARVAATTSTWGGVSGALRPEDSATRGATLGVNVSGQITAANAAALVGANAITNTMFGGDLLSTNWNGGTDSNGRGWALSRIDGVLYCNDVRARGTVSGGAFNQNYAWPANGAGGGFHISAFGFLSGNPNQPGLGYCQIGSNGEMHMPGFDYSGRQLTLTNTILIAPRNGDNMAASISGGGYYVVGTNQQFTDFYVGTYTANITNSSGNLAYSWSSTGASGFTTRVSNTGGATIQVYATGKLFQGQELDFFVNCTITDLNSGVPRPAQANSQIAANS